MVARYSGMHCIRGIYSNSLVVNVTTAGPITRNSSKIL